MGLIRDPGDEIKEGSSNRLNCICHNCREQLIQSRPQRNWAIKAEEGGRGGGGERKASCHLKPAKLIFKGTEPRTRLAPISGRVGVGRGISSYS